LVSKIRQRENKTAALDEVFVDYYCCLFLKFNVHIIRNRYSEVCVATRLQSRRSGVGIPVGARGFSILRNVHTCSGSHPVPFSEYRGSFPGVTRLGCDADCSPSSAEVKNEWSYTSSAPTYVGRDGFTFTCDRCSLL
jgi:hypothetical protein